MLEALLEKFIINYLGRYFAGLDKKKIDIGVWKGDITIENVALNHELFDNDSLPIEVFFSHIGKISLKVPWTRLSSSSVELNIEDLYLLVRIKTKEEWNLIDFNTLDIKFKILKKFGDTILEKLAAREIKPVAKTTGPSNMEKLLIKIIDNLQISIKNIHMRIECEETPSFCAGVYLANLKILTVDSSFNTQIYQKFETNNNGRVVRKLAKISSFQIYWASSPNELWFNNKDPAIIFARFRDFNIDDMETHKIISLTADFRLTISEKGGFYLDNANNFSKYALEVDVPFLDIKFTTSQVKDILTFVAGIDNYKSKMSNSLDRINYGIFRPGEKIKEAKPNEKASVIARWWQYAARAALHKEKNRMGMITKNMGEHNIRVVHEHTFKTLFQRIYTKKVDFKTLPRNELTLLEEITKGYSIGILKEWVQYVVLRESAGKQKQEQKNKAPEEDLFFLRRFLSGNNTETGFKEAEIKTLEKAILKSIYSDATEVVTKQFNLLKEEVPQITNENLIKLKFMLKFQKGSIFVINDNAAQKQYTRIFNRSASLDDFALQKPSYTLAYEGMEAEINYGTEKIDLTYKLKTFGFTATLRGVDINIISVNAKTREDPFLLFFMDQPIRRGSAPVKLHLGIGSIHFVYYPFVIYEFQNLLNLSSSEEKGKNVAMRELRNIGEKSKTKVEEYMQSPPEIILDIYIESPRITVPFPLWRETYLAETVSEMLVLNLGDLRISNQEISRAIVEKEMQKFATISPTYASNIRSNKEFDEMNISLSSINLVYYSQNNVDSTGYLSTSLQNLQLREELVTIDPKRNRFQEGFTIIENFSLNVNISKLKQRSHIENDIPEIKVSGKIYDISINLSAKTYQLLMLLAQRENDSRARVFLKEQKVRITQKATLRGHMSYQAANHKGWKRYYVMASGTTLYFYDNENELKSTFNIGIQSCKVLPPENPKQSHGFTIVNANGKHNFLCPDKDWKAKWVEEIKSKSTELPPEIEESLKEKPMNMNQQKVLTVISLEIDAFKITFKDDAHANWMILLLNNIYFFIENTSKEVNIRLKLESLDFFEANGVVVNKNLRSLIKSQSGTQAKNLIDVQVISIKEKNPEGGNIDTLINFKFGNLIINYKPKVIQRLLIFFKNTSTKTPKSMQEHSTPVVGDQQQALDFADFSAAVGPQIVEEEHSHENVALIMNFSAHRMTVYLELENLYLASLDVIDYQMNIRVKEDQLDVQGSLSQFKIYDLTNYPFTKYKSKDFDTFSPEEIFTTNKNESAVKFSFMDLSKDSKINNLNKRKKLLNLDFSSFNLLYFQQPTLRLINYFLDQILGVLVPDTPTRTVAEALRILDSPSFTEMRVTINRPKIRLKPLPKYKYYYEIDLGYIVLTNTHYKTASRVLASSLEDVWVEKYFIRFSEMVFLTVHNTEVQQVSEYFNLKMEVERMIFNTEYNTVYKTSKFDKAIHINGSFTPVILCLSKLNYLLMLSMLFSNVIFEDGVDSFFATSSPKPGAVVTITPVTIELAFDSIDILLLDNYNWPLLSLGIIHKSILITRHPNKEISIKLKGDKLFGNYYIMNLMKGLITENAYISHVSSTKDYTITKDLLTRTEGQKITNIWKTYAEIFENIKSLSKQRYIATTQESETNKFEMLIEMKSNSEKNITMEFSRLKLLFNLKITRIAANFFGYSEKVQLVTSTIGKEKIRKVIPQLNIDIQFSDCLVLLSGQADVNTIALKGKFSFIYIRNSYEEAELYQKSLKESTMIEQEILTKKRDGDAEENPEVDQKITSKWIFNAYQMEIIMGHLSDLIQLPAIRSNVTSIFLPFNIFITSENAIMHQLADKNSKEITFLNRSLKKFNFELANIRVTYKDFMNLIKIFQYQWESYSDYHDTINSKTNSIVFPPAPTSTIKTTNLATTSFSQMEFGLQGIHLVLINDVFGAHSPLLDFNIKNSEFIILTSGKTTLTSSLSLSLNFFNPFIGRWEPIVEPITLFLELYKAEPPSQYMSITVETGQPQNLNPLYLNISQEMITIVNRDLKLCMEEYRKIVKYEEIENLTDKDEENIQAQRMPISDYNRNDTSPEKMPNFFGYSISDKMSKIGLESDIYSPYAIFNRIGQSCYVEAEYEDDDPVAPGTNQTYHCFNNKLCGIYLENKTDDFYTATFGSGNEFRQLSQKIRIEIPLKLSYSFIINGVELNQVSQRRYTLVYQNPITGKEENYEIFSYVELVGTKRILTLSSVNKIVNSTNFKLWFKVINEDRQLEDSIEKDGEYAIPFTFNTYNISFRLENSNDWSIPMQSHQLNNTNYYQLEFNLKDNWFMVRKDTTITHMNVFVIEPPFVLRNFLPLPLTLDLFNYQNVSKTQNAQISQTLAESEQLHIYNFRSDTQLGGRIRLENLVVSEIVVLHSEKTKTLEKISLKDFAKQSCVINVYTAGEFNGCKSLFFYIDLYIKNQTPYNLVFQYKYEGNTYKFARQNDKPDKPGEQDNARIILGQTERPYQRVYICLKNDPSIKTKKISTQSIGGNSVVAENTETFLRASGANEAEGKLASYEFGVEINMVDHLGSLKQDKKYFVFSKVITVSPRYVIVNRTPYSIYLTQPKILYSSPFIVEPGERTPFFWKNSKLKKKVKILLVEPYKKNQTPDWKWSGSLELSTIGNQHFLCITTKGDEVRFFRATTIIEKSILYTVIEEQTDPTKLGYRIINDYPDCEIRFHQEHTKSNKQMHPFHIESGQQTGFSWQKPLLDKEIKFYVKFKNPAIDPLNIKCQPDKVNTIETFTIRSNGRSLNQKMHLKVYIESETKVLRFYPFTRQEEEAPKTEIEKFSFTVNLAAVGISLITTLDKVRKEVIFAGIKNFEFMWLESSENRTFHTRIKHLQIDNNSSLHAQYPVLLTPYNKINYEKSDKNTYFLDALITMSLKDRKSLVFPSVKLELSKPVLKIEDSFIDMILKVMKSFQDDMTKTAFGSSYHRNKRLSVASPPKNFMRPSYGGYIEYDWEKFNIETNTRSIYVEDFGLSYLEVIFSFKMSFDPFEKSEFSVTKLLSNALGVAITNIENAPIRLKGLEMKGVLDSPRRFIDKLGKHYKQELIKSVFYLLGSVEILGNPIGLFNHITTGMIDFIEKPREGFIRGPLEGGMGIVRGTGSLFRNTIVGTMGTVNKITGSVAAGISTLSLDQEFIKNRESLRKRKAHDVVDGLGQGLYSIYNGIEQGVVGLFTKPFEEASRTGFTGFLKGSYMALSGVVVKPMIGLLDAASKTAEGFKNMAEINNEGLLSIKERVPRAFYGKQMMFKHYIPYDAEMIFILVQTNESEMKRYSYIDAYPLKPTRDTTSVLNLVLFAEAVGLFSHKTSKFVWIAEYDLMEKVEQSNNFITFFFKKEISKLSLTTYLLTNVNLKVNELIVGQIRNMMKKT